MNQAATSANLTRFVSRDNARLAYELAGPENAPALVLLHDLLADRGAGRTAAGALAGAGFRVVLPDARGHGASAALGTKPYPTTSFAADVLVMLDAEALAGVHLVAHGWSAATALAVARISPERVRSLIFIQPALSGLLANDPDPAARWLHQGAKDALGPAATAAGKGLNDKALDLLLSPRWGAGWRQTMPRPLRAATQRHAGALAAVLPTMVGGGDRSGPIDVSRETPAFVLLSAQATDLDRMVADRLATALGQGPLQAVEPTIERPDAMLEPGDPATIAPVIDFLQAIPGG